MFAYLDRRRLILPLAPTLGGAFGLLVALAVAVMPASLLDSAVTASSIPSVLAAAEPPLGATARVLLLLIGGGGVALFAGVALWLVFGNRTIALGRGERAGQGELPVLRRADSHPDAPPRAPVRAHRDFGAPMLPLDSIVERAMPADLDQPLAAYDPAAIPDVPREPVRAVAPLIRLDRPQIIDPGDRFETFDPAPLGEPTATLHALLDRLERGIARRPRPARGLDQAVGDLRGLAS
ncbi:MAG TPA: hypothetical protein VFT56_05990 [Sphingomonas sp.]|nr:hypothetical protein [Sphingomonas sp.]